ncbi:hypothetical protein TUM22923_08010 [Polynucleobacter sp. TUM22923]|uniref:hypothetical protein n=1 Tax=Polynucleobacter sp. TUM22923 TaxID=3022126 RepID=UPI002573A274|nr:hypothetical protein [Polynucleobacter sp. TUM22923]BDX21480.1 hypothetical protein TUM22923_08010 [Polynucleobacter sp. TUM22923]
MHSNTAFLKEMGITEWTSRDAQAVMSSEAPEIVEATAVASAPAIATDRPPAALWWFFGNPPQGDAELLFQGIVRALGLSSQEWLWKNPSDAIDASDVEALMQTGIPMVALAFGGSVAQKLSGERDALPQLRETVLAFMDEGAQELPLIATFELNHLVSRPKDKALFWQDLLLAKSVLQNT